MLPQSSSYMTPRKLFVLSLTMSLATSVSAIAFVHREDILISSKPGSQHVASADEFMMIQLCFEEFLGKYGFAMSDDNKLPFRNSTLQVDIMLDSSHICSHFKQLNICMNGRYQELVDFDCLTNLTSSTADAVFYLNQLSMVEFFCGFSLPFIVYSQCLDQIAEDVTEAAYMQCSGIDWNSCRSVTRSLLCRRSLVETFCEDPSSASAFCTYQRIPLRITGWNNCENSPCCSSAFRLYHLTFLLVLIRNPFGIDFFGFAHKYY